MEEIWKDVKGWKGLYQVSNIGRVRSLDRVVHGSKFNRSCAGVVLKLRYDKYGYLVVNLKDVANGLSKNLKVHRLVAIAFIERISEDKNQVDHINGIRDDNRADNLRWCTNKENLNFPIAKQNKAKSTKASYVNNPNLRKLRAKTFGKTGCVSVVVLKNEVEIGRYNSQTEAAKAMGWSLSKVSALKTGRLHSNEYSVVKVG